MAAGTGDSLHPSFAAQQLQQHGVKCKSTSRHHACLSRAEEARPRAILPSQQPGFSFLVFVSTSSCRVPCFPQEGQSPMWTQGVPWFNGSSSPEARQQTAQPRAFGGRTTCTTTSRTGSKGFCRDWKRITAEGGDASYRIRVLSVYNKS